jgi:serine/threonine protein kinase
VALDTELGREVALKEIQARHADNASSRARFVLEAEITGGLEHPGIVPVYGLSCHGDGRPFYAMRFIKGHSLKEAIERFHHSNPTGDAAEQEVELRKLVRRFYDVCHAVEYAHSRGVLHRDLKPENIMLGQYGETLVVDWGLAKPLGKAESQPAASPGLTEAPLQPPSGNTTAPTQMGMTLGTPAFMPPEQAAGRLDLLDPRSDVYSLGATLYCLLTGRPPFMDKDVRAVLGRVERGEFPRPRQVKSTVPPALEAICLKAMALRPQQRYGSVAALGRDVVRWLDDAPVSAWPEPWSVRTRRWLRRHRTLVTATVAALLVALVSLGFATILLTSANNQLRQSNQSEQQAREAALQREKEAQEQRQVAWERLNEVREERERAHFYLESLLNLERFGRSLKRLSLRRDFDLHIQMLNGEKGPVPRDKIARGDFDKTLPFYISVDADRDCYLTVFYALPNEVKDQRKGESCLLLFPNRVEKDQLVHKGIRRILLTDPRIFLSPVVVTGGETAYLYVVASEKRWQVEPDRTFDQFYSFSPPALQKLGQQIAELVEGGKTPAAGGPNRLAEEIHVFNVRSNRAPEGGERP